MMCVFRSAVLSRCRKYAEFVDELIFSLKSCSMNQIFMLLKCFFMFVFVVHSGNDCFKLIYTAVVSVEQFLVLFTRIDEVIAKREKRG